jgi:hypothetical protein
MVAPATRSRPVSHIEIPRFMVRMMLRATWQACQVV